MTKIKGFIALFSFLFLSACMSSSPNPENAFTAVSGNTLDNGLEYQIHAKHDSSQKIQIRLFVQSGSLSETDQQQGYAHLLEHMAFNGTKNFPKNEIIELFEKSGLTFGQDINAYTSFTETVYTLSVPAEDKELLTQTLLYLRDILTDIEFNQAELDKEQGVVQNEYRLREPQEPPYYYAIFRDYIAGSEYQSHLPIGTLKSVGNSTEQGLKAFYKQWYRPNNAKLLISGDVNSELSEQLIIETFASIKKPDNSQIQTIAQPPKISTESKAFSSKVITFSQTDLFFELANIEVKNSDQQSQVIKQTMLSNMLNYRLNVLNSERKLPFSDVYSSDFSPLINKNFKSISINYQEGNADKSVVFISQELARLNQHGFSQAEFNMQYEAQQADQANLKNAYLNQTSTQIASQVIHSWTTSNVLLDYELQQQAYQKALASVTLDEINQLTRELIASPKKLTLAYPYDASRPDFLMVDKSFAKHINNPINNATIKIEELVLPVVKTTKGVSQVKSEKFYPKKQITQLSLNNGVNVILQPDSSVNNSISMTFSAPGGINALTAKEVAANTLLINSYINSGLAGLSPQTLQQQFSSAKAVLTPFVYNNSQGFTMQSVNNPKSLNLIFSMLYSAISDAKIKPEVFTQEKSKLITQQDSFLAQPTSGSTINMLDALFPQSPYQHVFTLEELQAIQKNDVEALYEHYFSSVNGYKLTIVGDFDIDEMKALVLQYVATLEGGEPHQFNHQPQALIQQATQLNESSNPQNNAIVQFFSITNTPNKSIKEVYQADLMRRIITQTLNQEIREKLSLTYSPYVSVSDQQSGLNFTEVFIHMITKVEDAQKTQQVVASILDNFSNNGITNDQLIDHQRGLTQGMLSNLHKSSDRQWFLHRDHLQGFELDSTVNAEAIVNDISLQDMNKFMKTYLDPTKTLQFINIPG